MDESAQPSKRALAGLKSHKLNSLNGLLTLGATPRNGHVVAQPVPMKRLEVIKAYAADCALPAEDATASQIAQRFAPRPESVPPGDDDRISASPLAPPLLALASGARTLAAALVAVALVPNLVLAALLWYGGIEPRRPSVGEPPPQQPEQSQESQAPVIRSVVTTPILLPPPARDTIAADEMTSALPREAVADLQETEQTGSLAVSVPDEPLGAAATGTDYEAQDLAAVATEETRSDSSAVLPEPMPLPTRRPAPPSEDAADASWIKATAYVNLRSAPSSGASVVAVVAKGSKLRAITRKRGWVQATDPATSSTGWIYGGNVAAAR
jgi:Bacterial SH3 domain